MADTKSPTSWLVDRALKFGPWAVLCFYLLGAIPGVASPFTEIRTMIAAHDKATADVIRENTAVQKDMLRTLRAICYKQPVSGPWAPCE